MNTLLTLHLVNIQPVFIFFIFLAGCLVAVSWMLVIKSSRYKELQEDYTYATCEFQESLRDADNKFESKKIEWETAWQEQVDKRIAAKKKHDEELAKCQETSDMWQKFHFDLKSSLPKPRERDNDGKFVKGSSRLDNLRKHLLEGNRTDRFTAQESFGIAHVGKFISTIKKEGFDIRKEKRKIAKDSFLTEYYLVSEKEAREWVPIEEDGVQTESAMNMGRTLAMGDGNKSITFDKVAQDAIPKDIRAKMDADKKQAEAAKHKRLTPCVTVKNPTDTEAQSIFDEAKRLGMQPQQTNA